jgi:TPR repeat protein
MAAAGNPDAALALGLLELSDETTPVVLDHSALWDLIPGDGDFDDPKHVAAARYFEMASRAGSQLATYGRVRLRFNSETGDNIEMIDVLHMLIENARPVGDKQLPECAFALKLYGWFVTNISLLDYILFK